MRPTIGRIVWYQAHGSPNGQHKSEPRAAVVTAAVERDPLGATPLDDERGYQVSLCVLNPTGMYFNVDVPFDAEGGPGTWRWPPRT